jgi:hypothetical protein
MSQIMSRLAARLSHRPDSEHQQALVRLVMLAVVVAYLQGVVSGRPDSAEPLRISLLFLAVEFMVALGILAWILARPGVSAPRRVLGMVADYSLMGVGMVLLGAHRRGRQQLGHAHDTVERGAEFVAHVGQEAAFGFACGLRRFGRAHQRMQQRTQV